MVPMNSKPVKTKPQYYAVILNPLQKIAKKHGYNLLVHGSMKRDLDLIAIPWSDNTSSHLTVLQHMSKYLGADVYDNLEYYQLRRLPGGRQSYIINLHRRGAKNNYKADAQYYLDISFTPFIQ